MQFKDYYETLGVARGADAEEVKRAYRKQARKYHPDVTGNSASQRPEGRGSRTSTVSATFSPVCSTRAARTGTRKARRRRDRSRYRSRRRTPGLGAASMSTRMAGHVSSMCTFRRGSLTARACASPVRRGEMGCCCGSNYGPIPRQGRGSHPGRDGRVDHPGRCPGGPKVEAARPRLSRHPGRGPIGDHQTGGARR